MKDDIGKLDCWCYFCGFKNTKSYNFTKHKWVRKYKCPKCKSESFRWKTV